MVGQGSGDGVRPGLVIVGLLVLVVGGCLVWPSDDATSTNNQSAPTTTPRSSVSLPPVPPAGPTWEGSVRLAGLLAFANGTPETGKGSASSLLRWNNDRQSFSLSGYGDQVGRWGGSDAPSYEECVASINQNSLSRDEVRDMPWSAGSAYCFSHAEVVVFVRSQGLDGDALGLDAIVWRKAQQEGR